MTLFILTFGGWISLYVMIRYFEWKEARDMSHVLDDPLVREAAFHVAFSKPRKKT